MYKASKNFLESFKVASIVIGKGSWEVMVSGLIKVLFAVALEFFCEPDQYMKLNMTREFTDKVRYFFNFAFCFPFVGYK